MKIIKKMMKIFNWKCTFIIILLYYMNVVKCSEFPERECCDPIFPEPEPMPPALPTTTTLPSSPSTLTGRSGPNIKTAIAILNCILARQLCFEDPSCSAILEIIPRVCGPVPVSCSTVTVTKCQAALRTLQAFPFFRPTCLCKEPGIDPDCNYFRDFLFDHPCGFVLKKAEKDPYPIDALPTCNHALSLCQQDRKCIKLFEDFKTHCKVRDNRCRMEDRDACHEAWTNLRLSPMFGCICPNNHMKRRCDKIFSMVNHNPCIDDLSFSLDMSSDIETNSIYPNIDQNNETTVKTFPTYPHFLFPSTKQIPLALASHRPATTDYIHYISQNHYPPSYKSYHSDNDNDIIIKSTNYEHANSQTNTNINNNNNNNNTMHWHNSYSYNSNNYNSNNNNYNNNYNAIKMNKSFNSNDNKAFNSPDGYDKDLMEIARSLGNSIIMLDETMTPIETPLLPSTNAYYTNGESIENQIVFPYNITAVQTSMNSGIIPTLNNYVIDASSGNSNGDNQNEYYIPPPPPPEIESNEIVPIPYQSTCHVALETCREDSTCSTYLHSVTSHCELYRCNRNMCMDALQKFFRNLYDDLSLDIAFCICRKTTTHHDKCMLAQEKLHPICAKRAPDNYHIHNGINYPHPPSCNSIVEICREDEYCSKKLEIFEQGCAFDSTTNKCAGKISLCRQAVVGVLGTPLRTSCSCHGTEQQQHYDCLGWQKLFWLNPCVVEAQRDFHIKRLTELGILTTTTVIPPVTLPNHRPPSSSFDFDTNYIDSNPDSIPETLMQNGNEIDDGNENLNNENFSNNKDDSINNNNSNNDLNEKILIHLTGNDGTGGGGSGGVNGDGSDAITNIGNGDNANIKVDGGKFKQDIITEMEIKTTTVIPSTTTRATLPTTHSTTLFTIRVPSGTTSQPIRYCVVQRPYQNDQYIPEGQSKRIKSDDAECSELCSCGDTGEPLSLACHALCVPMIPCRTPLAYYNHAAPAYQAYRGRCLCYSGRFICMRPPPGEYILPGGVYLLLGYSTADESMLRPHTNLGVQDAVRSLQHYLYTHITNRTSCTLTLFNMTDENVILSARLPHDIRGSPGQILYKEKKFCQTILETISHHINSQYVEFTGHPLLSIFKMAEVQVIMPDVNSSNNLYNLNNKTNFFYFNYIIFILLFIQWLFNYKFFLNLT